MRSFRVSLIGSGNVASHLGKALLTAGHRIIEVCSRNPETAAVLAADLSADPVGNPAEVQPGADIYIIAVKDEAVIPVLEQLKLPGSLIVHTSGTLPLIQHSSVRNGVFYPFQTFTKNIPVNFSEVPVCIEAGDPATLAELNAVGASISGNVQVISSEKRKILHIAGVFASNFSNHLYAIASDLLEKEHMPAGLLLPLIRQTANKVQLLHPEKAQTGPAVRNDEAVLNAHLKHLEAYPELHEIYQLLTRSIQSRKS